MRFASKWTKCTVHAIRDVTPAIREFVLRPEDSSVENYAVGSHVTVGVLVDGRPETRCYSLVGDVSPMGTGLPFGVRPTVTAAHAICGR
jgi:dimethylamine monooxygenase subunit B